MPCEAIVTARRFGAAKIDLLVMGFMELESSNLSAYLMIGTLAALVFGSLLYGVYMAFGAGSEQLTDQIEEHSRLHKLGIVVMMRMPSAGDRATIALMRMRDAELMQS